MKNFDSLEPDHIFYVSFFRYENINLCRVYMNSWSILAFWQLPKIKSIFMPFSNLLKRRKTLFSIDKTSKWVNEKERYLSVFKGYLCHLVLWRLRSSSNVYWWFLQSIKFNLRSLTIYHSLLQKSKRQEILQKNFTIQSKKRLLMSLNQNPKRKILPKCQKAQLNRKKKTLPSPILAWSDKN